MAARPGATPGGFGPGLVGPPRAPGGVLVEDVQLPSFPEVVVTYTSSFAHDAGMVRSMKKTTVAGKVRCMHTYFVK